MKTVRLFLPSTGSSRCTGCGAPIDWYEAVTGRKMCVNGGTVHLKTLGGGPDPEIGVFDAADTHWVSCPDAEKFRR